MKYKFLLLLSIFLIMDKLIADNIFKPVINTDLRVPSVPLLTSDPYFSIWSPYDQLNDGTTKHWSNAEKPLLGAIRVDGNLYRFMGKQSLETLVPMSQNGEWKGEYTFDKPAGAWTSLDYQTIGWKNGLAAFGTADQPNVGTVWNTKDIWIRRSFVLEDDLKNFPVFLQYSHDDVFEIYLNGELLVSTDYCWRSNVVLELTEKMKKNLRKGKNVLSAHCRNTVGGGYVDFGLYRPNISTLPFENVAVQKSVNILPTQTYYTFSCGPVDLNLVFTAPLLLDDLDLISTPINYISYQVCSNDNKVHDVQLYIETNPLLSVYDKNQSTMSKVIHRNGLSYIQSGTVAQPYTARSGDAICIDWGYAYLAAKKNHRTSVSLANSKDMKESFISTGRLYTSQKEILTESSLEETAMAYCDNLGKVSSDGSCGFLMMGYDDIYSVEYMYKRRMAYWKHGGKVDMFKAFERAALQYDGLMKRCRDYDMMIYTDAEKAGGKKYAEICAASYRQVIAAHKLFTDDEGRLMYFSKENNSNGCINTVDLTYPSSPLFLLYNTELQKAMMTSIFEYSASKRWTKPFPAHDLGTYPIANGQTYGGDMPIEEAGNMVILTTAISKIEGNADYAKQYWDLLTEWTDYLVKYGLDPENQLCTDDFAGHWAHNANLSLKAIVAIAAYSEMAQMLGLHKISEKYTAIAKDMANEWVQMAKEGDHYRLAFDRKNTWSQKYNMVWDKLWNLNLFPKYVMEDELKFYLTKQNTYGLPLDSRKEYTKSDWIMWTATMSSDSKTFQKFIDPIYKYINETSSRVPISDWHDTISGKWIGFCARSVIGGYWMQVLMDKTIKNYE